MSKKLKQFRFYGNGDERNSPKVKPIEGTDVVIEDYQTGKIFELEGVFPISQLGIQGPPGTKFYLNGSVKYITIGISGIYDLDIKNGSRITRLGFDRNSLERINPNGTGYLIVDILYGEED